MQNYEFQVVLADYATATEELANLLFEAGCNDGTLFSCEGTTAIGFSREAANLEEAVRSAIQDVTSIGARVIRVESVDGPIYSRINAELSKT